MYPPDQVSQPLRVYLEGRVEFEEALEFQHLLVEQVCAGKRAPALLLCEHDGIITVGREGGPADVRCDPAELRARRWRVRWVNRGGGSILHLPGQLAIYPIIPLARRGMDVGEHVVGLQEVLRRVLSEFGLREHVRPGQANVQVGDRTVAAVGVAVRDWVSYFGAVLNIDPDLPTLQHVGGEGPATSIARERRGPLRAALVRERLVEHLVEVFGFEAPAICLARPRECRSGKWPAKAQAD